MSETVKLIIEIPKDAYGACRALKTDNDQGILAFCVVNAVADGVPLDHVKAEIKELTKAHCIQVMDREDIPLLALDIIEKYKGDSE